MKAVGGGGGCVCVACLKEGKRFTPLGCGRKTEMSLLAFCVSALPLVLIFFFFLRMKHIEGLDP